MKKTLGQIKEADQLVAYLYSKNPTLQNGKLGHAWKRFVEKNYKPLADEMNEKLIDNRVNNALTDKTTGEILYTADKNFKFDREGTKAILEFNRKLTAEYDAKEVNIIPFIVKGKDLPELTSEEKEILTGLVL